jgi:4-amino-4-deoxy-L-arabinose transferase-like glycosyltransferase
VLVVLGLPWILWAWRLRAADYWRDRQFGAVRLLAACWLLVIVGFFSLPQSKLVGYILPAVPPLSLLIADAGLPFLRATRLGQRLWRASAGLALAVCVGAIAALSLRQGHSHQDLAATLAARRSAGEPIVFVDEYFWDLQFYARLRQPVQVVADWDRPEVGLHDNWRKELFDAGKFASRAAAASLITPQQLPIWLCRAGSSWIVTPADATAERFAFLGAAEVVQRNPRALLWHVDARSPAAAAALACAARAYGG